MNSRDMSYDLYITQGDKWRDQFHIKYVDGTTVSLADVTVRFVAGLLSDTTATPVLDFGVDDGKIVTSNTRPNVTFAVPSTDTEVVSPGVYDYQLKTYEDDEPLTVLYGRLHVRGDVSR